MHISCSAILSFLLAHLCFLTFQQVSASPSALDNISSHLISARDGGHHNQHAAPLLQLNETEIIMHHAPTPPSYYTIDWEGDGSEKRHPELLISHAVLMSLAFFLLLPVGIIMRSVKQAGHGAVMVTFYALCALGCSAGALYTKLTPNMYQGAAHGRHGYLVLLFAVLVSALDILAAIGRMVTYFRSQAKKSLVSFWETVILNKEVEHGHQDSEYLGLVVEEPEDFEGKLLRNSVDLQTCERSGVSQTALWANDVHRHHRHSSTTSERTVFGLHSTVHSDDTFHDSTRKRLSKRSFLRRLGTGALAVAERVLVFAGFAQLLTGIVVYTGGCRGNYLNGCMAHLIKGGIFWSYGLVTFARFLGSFAELGWAWNRAPSLDCYSAEFVESFVIFLYGATNMWMERFGAHAGDPFTTRQIQHISIAVMFCFSGVVGMGIESKRIRKWLASSTFASLSKDAKVLNDAVTEPPSYLASFNPFPALVIGVTGAAMAAHAQTYLFQVQIHALWGNLLVAFAVLRCFTYFFLWLGPPQSILPSRPPTEALGSFFLACGGLVFMFSIEEVTIAAMRRGRDDVMMFLNLSVAITCFACCWTLFVVGFKGWLKSRTHSVITYRSPA